MRYLFDTQILVWSLEDNPKLKPSLRILIEVPSNTIFVSQLSLMELSIKLKLGKLPEFIVSIEFIASQLVTDGFIILPLKNEHIFSYQSIPFFENHRDPFRQISISDRIIRKNGYDFNG